MTFKKRPLILLCLLVLLVSTSASATQIAYRSVESMGEESSLVVRGNVREVRSFWNDGRTRILTEVSVRVADPNNAIDSLSGGNQQKVVVAKGLLTEPRVLLLDEPTRGIDVGAKSEIFQIMSRLAEEGFGIVFVSSELKEVMAMSDRILVLSKGEVVAEFEGDQATEKELVDASAVGHGTTAMNKGSERGTVEVIR